MNKRITPVATILAIVLLLVLPLNVFAASQNSSTILSGTVPSSLSISATSSITLPSLITGTTVTNSAPVTVTITTNASGWSLTAAENGSGDGKMCKSDGITTLTNPLFIKGGEISNYTSLAPIVKLKNGTGEPVNNLSLDIGFQQQVTSTEKAGDYSITIVFTISTPS